MESKNFFTSVEGVIMKRIASMSLGISFLKFKIFIPFLSTFSVISPPLELAVVIATVETKKFSVIKPDGVE